MIDLGNGVKLITRAEWGARPPRSRTSLVPSFGTTTHWEGPHMGSFPHSSCASKVRGIQNYHMDQKGWQDIAYTALTCPHGYVFQGRWTWVRTAANGTNTGNSTAYAVCYLGGEGDPFTAEAQRAQLVVLNYLDHQGGAGDGRNCHRDWKATQCPGNVICGWVKTTGQRDPAFPPAPPPPPPPPPPTTKKGKMLYLIKLDDRSHVWLTDWLTKRHMWNGDDVNLVVWFTTIGGLPVSRATDGGPHIIKDLEQKQDFDRIPVVGTVSTPSAPH